MLPSLSHRVGRRLIQIKFIFFIRDHFGNSRKKLEFMKNVNYYFVIYNTKARPEQHFFV